MIKIEIISKYYQFENTPYNQLYEIPKLKFIPRNT